MLRYVRYLEDFPVRPIANFWPDVRFSSRVEDKTYVVQTASKVVARCLLMATDPGDLVLDPTCGSGITAYVAGQRGRRWITIDNVAGGLLAGQVVNNQGKFEFYDFNFNSSAVDNVLVRIRSPQATGLTVRWGNSVDDIFSANRTLTAWQQIHETGTLISNQTLSIEDGAGSGHARAFYRLEGSINGQ
jgi:hypothetical protein